MVDHGFKLAKLISQAPERSWTEGYRLLEGFSLSSREQAFAKRLLRDRRSWWLWRCHQQAFAGDFLLVNLSEPRPEARRVVAVELKAGEPLREAGGVQLSQVPLAVAELVEAGVLGPSPETLCLIGDKQAVLDWVWAGAPALG